MIRFVKREDISEQAWNLTVSNDSRRVPYALTWYLDAVCEWEALIGNEYEWVMPLPYNLKLPIKKQVAQPFFVQQLGVFGKKPTEENWITILKALKKRYWRIILQVPKEQGPSFEGFAHKDRMNYQLSLAQSYDDLWMNYSKSIRQRVRKNSKKLKWEPTDDWNHLLAFHKQIIGTKAGLSSKSYDYLKKLCQNATRHDAIEAWFAIESRSHEKVLGAAILKVGKYRINLFGASSDKGRSICAMHVFLDRIIKKYADQDLIFDFEGSDVEGIGMFFKSFGSTNRPYVEVQQKNLTSILKIF